jgi:phosphoesterase RecJ-like protein
MIEAGPLVCLEWEKAHDLITRAQNIVVVTHIRPDGDAIGSLMGLTLVLREQGKAVTPVVDGGLPERFAFVPASRDILSNVDGLTPDLVISTDASDFERLGKAGIALRAKGCPLLQLDHHQTNLLFGDVQLVDARTAAAAEGVLDLMEYMGWELSLPVAQCLLTGIITDTLCFRTDNVTPAVMGKAQRLMAVGASLSAIVQRTLSRQPTRLLRLYGQVLSRLIVEDGVIWLTVTTDDYRAVGMEAGEYHGLASYLIESEDAVISLVFKAVEANEIEVSLRAVPGFDVAGLALELGGGGHVLASGFTLRKMNLEDAIALVLPKVKAAAASGQRVYQW